MSKLKISSSDYTSADIYKYYKATHSSPLSKTNFMLVIKLFNKKLIDGIYRGMVAKLPMILGFIGVEVKTPIVEFTEDGSVDFTKSRINTDWGETNKLWREKPELAHKTYVFHENSHTNGKKYKIMWNRKYSNIGCIRHYRFLPAKGMKRGFAKYLRENPNTEYYDF